MDWLSKGQGRIDEPLTCASDHLSHRVWRTYADILDACRGAWNALADGAAAAAHLCSLHWAAPART